MIGFCQGIKCKIGRKVLRFFIRRQMRIWTIHPCYLDRQGLLSVWRETLLAQAVLLGKTKGYRHHPQLDRFRQQHDPVAAIATYLTGIHEEARRRGYRFDQGKVHGSKTKKRMPETEGQLLYEWAHLKAKLKGRSPDFYSECAQIARPLAHPIFRVIPGEIRDWEKQIVK